MKSLLNLVADGTVFAAFLIFAAVAILLLVVIPGGLAILSLELDRLKQGLTHQPCVS